MSREIPIIFSKPMVLAILAGKKTMTRRVVYNKKGKLTIWAKVLRALGKIHDNEGVRVGDKLWVRENWRANCPDDPTGAIYKADQAHLMPAGGKWRPSIHMPRWACRIKLEVTAVKIERVQDISHADACAEGMGIFPNSMSAQKRFKEIWEAINGVDSWASNPEVVAVSFKVL